jgi:hypothetical protein
MFIEKYSRQPSFWHAIYPAHLNLHHVIKLVKLHEAHQLLNTSLWRLHFSAALRTLIVFAIANLSN